MTRAGLSLGLRRGGLGGYLRISPAGVDQVSVSE